MAVHLSVTDPREKPAVPRGQHMKGHGCLRAEFTVLPDLPEVLRHGVFARPQTFDACIRFSNGKGQDDRQPDAHGMAIKLLGVPGEKLLEDEKDATTQDFVLFDNPVFFIKNVADYVPFMEDFRHLKSPGLTFGKIIAALKLFFSQDYKWRCLRHRQQEARQPTPHLLLEHDPLETRAIGREIHGRAGSRPDAVGAGDRLTRPPPIGNGGPPRGR